MKSTPCWGSWSCILFHPGTVTAAGSRDAEGSDLFISLCVQGMQTIMSCAVLEAVWCVLSSLATDRTSGALMTSQPSSS